MFQKLIAGLMQQRTRFVVWFCLLALCFILSVHYSFYLNLFRYHFSSPCFVQMGILASLCKLAIEVSSDATESFDERAGFTSLSTVHWHLKTFSNYNAELEHQFFRVLLCNFHNWLAADFCALCCNCCPFIFQ